MSCTEPHCLFQPTEEEWRCPNCNGDSSVFYISKSKVAPVGLCEDEIHDTDTMTCNSCKKSWKGKELSVLLMKKAGLSVCSHCNGIGLIREVSE